MTVADPVEGALLRALEVATRAGHLEAIMKIVEELRARRVERAGLAVVDLVAERERRGG